MDDMRLPMLRMFEAAEGELKIGAVFDSLRPRIPGTYARYYASVRWLLMHGIFGPPPPRRHFRRKK